MTLDHEPIAIALERITPISQTEINRIGYEIKLKLTDINPTLTPSGLREAIGAYKNFEPLADGLMWQRAGSELVEKKHDQVLLLFSGPPAVGKHHVLIALESLLTEPSVGLITDTTRDPKEITVMRDGREMKKTEINGVHHNFLTVELFKEKIRKGEYIEWIEQRPGKFYGTPNTALVEAFHQKNRLIVSDLELASGWAQIERFVATLPPQDRPKILEVFLLPGMSAEEYYVKWNGGPSWLKRNRPEDYGERSIRAAAEIYFASQRAEFLLVNPINEGEEALPRVAQSLAETIQKYSSVPLLRYR